MAKEAQKDTLVKASAVRRKGKQMYRPGKRGSVINYMIMVEFESGVLDETGD